MPDLLMYIGCGLVAGVLGGYLGLGGGIVIVPYLVVLAGQDIKAAVPVSLAAITVNSLSSSTEYLKKRMVDLDLVVTLATFLTVGNVCGSLMISAIPRDPLQLLFTAVLIYGAVAFLLSRKPKALGEAGASSRRITTLAIVVSSVAGLLGGLVGVGGGVILVPALYLLMGIPLTTARGTATFMMGFSTAASTVVLMVDREIDYAIAGPVILGTIVGGKIGGLMGTVAKPVTVRVILFVVLIYMAIRLGWEPLARLLQL
jgi:uncharacterized membrane protein YfcA